MNRTIRCLLALAIFASLEIGTTAAESPLWIYVSTNFQVDRNVDQLAKLLRRSKAAGYNGAVITDYKFGKIEERPDNYYRNLQRTYQLARELDVELIPCVMPIGYSNSILQNDPNLAAALPVTDCLFVAGRKTASVADASNQLPGGGFDVAERNRPAGWDWVDGFGTSATLDTREKRSGASSLRMTDFKRGNEYGNCRVVRTLQLKPYHQYRVTLSVKTDRLDADEFKVMPLANGRVLSHAHVGIKPTQDWTQHRIVFNSLNHQDARLYIGLWGGRGGSIWIDDVSLEVVGGVNLVRRAGCPLRVIGADSGIEYREGRDFRPWSDPKLGSVPYLGEYDDDHDAPPIELAADSRIRPGEQLRVSFYHTAIIHDGQVACSLVSDDLFPHLERQVQQLNKYWKPSRYFMQHDEIRLAGHDELARGRPSGQLLAENARRCAQVIRSVRPDAKLIVWSDMFDPHHNAVDDYYLVRGSLAGSWTGLEPAISIANWNNNKRSESLKWFASRGHDQVIAGYYDGDVKENLRRWQAAESEVGVTSGYMYTTWRSNYDDLEAFARLVRAARGQGR